VPLFAEVVPTATASIPSTPATAARIFGRAMVRVEPPATAFPPTAGVAVGRATSSTATAVGPARGASLKPASGAVATARGPAWAVAAAVHVAGLGFCGEAEAGREQESVGYAEGTTQHRGGREGPVGWIGNSLVPPC
jgi:hypothetical protein